MSNRQRNSGDWLGRWAVHGLDTSANKNCRYPSQSGNAAGPRVRALGVTVGETAQTWNLPLAFRIISYGCLLFVAVPCWVGLTLNWMKLW